MNSIRFQLVTPERVVLKDELLSLSCPTTLGQITILPGHVPLVATLASGELIARSGAGEKYLHVSGGFIEVKPGNEVIALADSAEHAHEIDEAATEEAKRKAQEVLARSHASDEEYAQAAASLERSLSRLRVSRKRSHRTNPITSEGTLKE